jgi:peptidoglycan/LPS O-acetylase OafA/YrhL
MTVNSHAPVNRRYHGLDILRACALILGLFFHAAIPFAENPYPLWIVYYEGKNWLYDTIMVSTHSFRMPLFFLLAGFFSALLYRKLSARNYVIARTKKLILPFIAALLIFTPLIIIEYMWVGFDTNPWETGNEFHWKNYPIFHFWFLEILIIITALVMIFFVSIKYFFPNIHNSLQHFLEADSNKHQLSWNVLFLACLVFNGYLSWSNFPGDQFIDSFAIAQPLDKIFYYLCYFLIGWLLYRNTSLFDRVQRSVKMNLILGSIALIVLLWVRYWLFVHKDEQLIMLGILGNIAVPIAAVYLSLGLFGFFTHEKFKPSATFDYLVRASYWIYLIHLPIILYLQVIMTGWPIPAFIKYVFIIAVAFLISCLTYSGYEFTKKLLTPKK